MIKANKENYPIRKMVKWLKVSKSSWYDWSKQERTPKWKEDLNILEAIRIIQKRYRNTYGLHIWG